MFIVTDVKCPIGVMAIMYMWGRHVDRYY